MIKNTLIVLFSYQTAIYIVKLQFFNDYINASISLVLISKIAIIFSIIGLLWETIIYIMNYKSINYRYKELKKKVHKITDSRKILFELFESSLIVLMVLLLFIIVLPKESRNDFIRLLYLQSLIAEIYFIFRSFNNFKVRNGIYSNGVFFMGKFYKWKEIDDIKVKRQEREIHIIRFHQGILLGNSIMKIKYGDNKIANYIENKWERLNKK